jgi:hypothetical protein
MSRIKLTDEHKTYVVKRLAAYDKPKAIARDLAQELGATLTHHGVAAYDPTRRAGKHLAPRWRALFARERAAYHASTAGIGVDKAGPARGAQDPPKDPPKDPLGDASRDASRDPPKDPSSDAPETATRLTDKQKIYVVRRLAAFEKARAIVQDLAREFGVTVSIKAIESYNPCLSTGRHLGERWRALFAEAREEYHKSTAEIGYTHKAVRIQKRASLVDRAEAAGQFKAASDILDAIARDVGDILDKRQTHDRFKFKDRGAAAAATIIINGRTAVEPAPQAAPRVRKPRD